MIQSWFVDLIDLIVNKFQNGFIICFFIYCTSKYLETMPNDVWNTQICLFSDFCDGWLLGDVFYLSQDGNEISSENLHVLFTGVFLQGS